MTYLKQLVSISCFFLCQNCHLHRRLSLSKPSLFAVGKWIPAAEALEAFLICRRSLDISISLRLAGIDCKGQLNVRFLVGIDKSRQKKEATQWVASFVNLY